MAAEGVVELVEKLQSRLTGGGEPKKLYKSLKRLAELPITIEILAETGVGKTVNSLRKHELVGEFAKSLVARWKKLVPQEVDRNNVNSSEREPDRGGSRKHPRDPSPQEDEEEQESRYRTMVQVSLDKKSRKESDRVHKVQEERWHHAPPEQNSDIEDFDDGPSHLVEPPDSPPLIYIDQRDPDRSSSHRKTVKGPRESFEVATMNISKEHRPHLDKYHVEAKVAEVRSQDRLSKHAGKELLREQHKVESSLGGSWQKLENLEGGENSAKKWRGHELVNLSSISRKERSQSDIGHEHASPHGVLKKEPHESSERVKKQKHIEKEKSKGESTRFNTDGQSAEREKARTEREVKSKSRSADTSMHEKKSVKFFSALDSEEEDMFEQPTMSFESCLTYDLPKKKKKPARHPAPPPPLPPPPPPPPNLMPSVKGSNSSRQNGARESSKASEPSRKHLHPKRERTPSPPAKARKIKIDAVPVLPDIPLPPIQPNYRPLPTLDTVPFSPQKKKLVTPTLLDEEEAGFTGRRFNSKMQVYSGSKTTYLPKMMSLYEQCIRVLANNIDLIDEVGGVPYSLLEPVLEKCTPEQLYRIEECNHVLIEDTDRLWMGHCQRDFKKEQAEEFESWREMYLRLHDAREQKLAMLTQNIRSAHANRPKGRQAKMAFVNVEAKPPRDVRRRQEKFGTGGAVVKEKIRIKPAPFAPMRTSLAPSEESYTAESRSYSDEPRSYDGPSTSTAYSGTSTSSVSPPLSDPRRPPVKKTAPMMAKTIKAFKNRFSRR